MKYSLYNRTKEYLLSFDKRCYLIILGMLYATIFFSSFVMGGYKTVSYGGRVLCASVFIFPLLFPINDSIMEIFGVKVSYFMILAVFGIKFFDHVNIGKNFFS